MAARKSPGRKSPGRRPAAKRVAKPAVTRGSTSPVAKRTRGTKSATPEQVEAQLLAIEQGDGTGDVDVGGGATVHVSSLGKVYFPESRITKGVLMRYYTRVSPSLLPHLQGRPLVLKRYPDGVSGQMFFQQDAGSHVPDFVRVARLSSEERGMRTRIIGGDLGTLLYTVQLGAIEVHPWLSRLPDIDHPDRCLIDLDPGDDVPFTDVVALARDVRTLGEECGFPVAIKTSGASGIHLVIPLPPGTTYDASARLAMLLAEVLVAARPEKATVERSIRARPKGTIYVDALQNARGKSMAGPYSVRARPAASVSTPLRDAELTGRLRTEALTVKTVPARISRWGDLWGAALAGAPTLCALARGMQLLEETLSAQTPGGGSTRSRAGGAGAASGAGRRRSGRA